MFFRRSEGWEGGKVGMGTEDVVGIDPLKWIMFSDNLLRPLL
jgi:hypothetical protein